MDEDFGVRLRRRREAVALSQRELAELAQLSTAAVRDLEQGRTRRPQPASIRRLVDALGLTGPEAEAFRGSGTAPSGPPERPADPAAAIGAVHIRILGPLELSVGGRVRPIGANQQRTLLARLALSPGQPVSRAELLAVLWGEEPPDTAVNMLQTCVARLRRLAAGLPIRPRGTAYVLGVSAGQLDLLAFRDLADGNPSTIDNLAAALALWRGAPVADVPALAEHPAVTGLVNEHIAAALRLFDHADEAGTPDRALPYLRDLADRHPLHEPLWGRLMLGLAAGGRQGDALDAYSMIRERLAGELGLDPGPELAALHRRVLRQDWQRPTEQPPAREPGPWQAPAPVADFTGRARELAHLLGLLERDPNAPAAGAAAGVVVAAIVGPGGAGKTALALAVAHRLRGAFPDGQLYADLGGERERPPTAAEVLGRWLRALGVDPAAIPVEGGECAARYRSILSGRRMLVIVDNARDAAQVRDLLPGDGGCAVLMTSRRRPTGLASVRTVELDSLPFDDAYALLGRVAGVDRLTDADAAATVVRLCGRLPLALRIAGARLAHRPTWTIADVARRLDDEVRRLDELRAGDLELRATFAVSYQSLTPAAARAFRLLATAPVDELSTAAAAALFGTDAYTAEDLLDDLVDGSLVRTPAAGRFDLHDLLRLYGKGLGPGDPDAQARLLRFFTVRVAEATHRQRPNLVRLPAEAPFEAGSQDLFQSDTAFQSDMAFQSDAAALDWLDLELPNIVALIGHTAAHGPHPVAWTLADRLRGYFFSGRHTAYWLSTGTAGRAAARHDGDPVAEAAMAMTLGQAYWSTGDFTRSLDEYAAGRTLAAEHGWPAGAAYMRHNIGLVRLALGDLDGAAEAYRTCLDECRRDGLDYILGVTLNDLGNLHWEQGSLAEAAGYHAEALALNRRLGDDGQGVNLHNLGGVYADMGRTDEGLALLDEAREYARRTGSAYSLAAYADDVARIRLQRGEFDLAEKLAADALDDARARNDRVTESSLLIVLGSVTLGTGDLSAARTHIENAYALATEVGVVHIRARALNALAETHLRLGDHAAARAAVDEALGIARAKGYRLLEIDALFVLASLSEPETASALYASARDLARAGGAQSRVERATSALSDMLPEPAGA